MLNERYHPAWTGYYQRSPLAFPFWLLAVVAAIVVADGIDLLVRYYDSIPPHARFVYIVLVVFLPLPWLSLYLDHKRIRQQLQQSNPENLKLLGAAAHSTFTLVLTAYYFAILSLIVIGRLLHILGQSG